MILFSRVLPKNVAWDNMITAQVLTGNRHSGVFSDVIRSDGLLS